MGLFITFEGIEGCGKTTQAGMLRDYLEGRGVSVLLVREPGSTEKGERIREILLNTEGEGLNPWAELFLYEASRAQLISTVIVPALEEGKVVISDRFTDSTLAYQGYGRGLDIDAIASLNRWASLGITPNLTFLIDCTPLVGLQRAWGRINSRATPGKHKEDRFEKEDLEFHQRVREGYLKIAEAQPQRIRLIDGERDVDTIHREICSIVDKYIE